MYKQYEVVKLIGEQRLKDALTGKLCRLPAGCTGTIVEVYKAKGVAPAYEVEFIDSKGNSVVATVQANAVTSAKQLVAGKAAEVRTTGKLLLMKGRKKVGAKSATPKTKNATAKA